PGTVKVSLVILALHQSQFAVILPCPTLSLASPERNGGAKFRNRPPQIPQFYRPTPLEPSLQIIAPGRIYPTAGALLALHNHFWFDPGEAPGLLEAMDQRARHPPGIGNGRGGN
uniref:Uncharacterized protein n=1 Tax=Aegilops tauschii subsp. strangulata TaxID=200361 RepID=A0A453CFH8_AEGTS